MPGLNPTLVVRTSVSQNLVTGFSRKQILLDTFGLPRASWIVHRKAVSFDPNHVWGVSIALQTAIKVTPQFCNVNRSVSH
jgi:hypothetical protein